MQLQYLRSFNRHTILSNWSQLPTNQLVKIKSSLLRSNSVRWINTKSSSNAPTQTPSSSSRSSSSSSSSRRKFSAFLYTIGVFSIGFGGGIILKEKLSQISPSEPIYITIDPSNTKNLHDHLETQMLSIPLVKNLIENEKEWKSFRPYSNLDIKEKAHHMTAHSLAGPGKIGISPIVFIKRDNENELIAIIHLGHSLCGHKGFIHGGLLATILDEAMARIAISNLPSQLCVTANLNINYRIPTQSGQFIVAKTRIIKKDGRKVNVEGKVETIDGKLLVDATGLFIEPKYAKYMKPILNVVVE